MTAGLSHNVHFIFPGLVCKCPLYRSITTVLAQPKDKQTGEPDKVQPAAAATADTLLIVESSVKATKVQKYLGSKFKVSKLLLPACTSYTSNFHKHSHCFTFLCKQVLASQGHIIDLVAKAGSVTPSANLEMKRAVAKQAKVRLDAIKQALQQAGMNRLVLATD